VPVGLINSSWGGTSAEAWTPTEAIESDVILKTSAYKLKEVPWGPVKPGLNFNGMIAPLIHYNIAGALWYQGEANTINGETYSRLLKTMIDNWRRLWKKDFPFYYVQIAPYAYGRPYEGAVVMEQQSKLMQYPGCGMVVVTDLIDSVTNIHPSNKLDVGNRLANWALAETYHKNMGAYKSPVYKSMVAKGNKIVVTIADAPNGLVRKGKAITGFYIAGTNNEWLPAEATIDGSSITVWNNKIAAPVQVRYSFGNTIVGNVFSKEGLPLCPFRTDNEKL
jgi:sialate O-acetylesterase